MKHRELRFAIHGLERIDEAGRFLTALGSVTVTGRRGRALAIEYSLAEHSFRRIEKLLRAQGFLLDSSFSMRLIRAVLYFCEDTQMRNLRQPERLIKKSNEIYVKAWQHHPHGDHDDTPTELRDYR